MRKKIYGRTLKRDTHERKALFRNLMRDLIINGQITTTEAKAKSIKGPIEKLVTKAKTKQEKARPILMKVMNKDIADKMLTDIAPKFTKRPGGYTRIIRLGPRLKDNASMVQLEWVETIKKTVDEQSKESKKDAKSTSKKSAKSSKKTTGKTQKATKKAAPKKEVKKTSLRSKISGRGKSLTRKITQNKSGK